MPSAKSEKDKMRSNKKQNPVSSAAPTAMKKLIKHVIITLIICVAVYLTGSALRKLSPIKSEYFALEVVPLEGLFEPNEILPNHMKFVSKGKLHGPESLAIKKDRSLIFTSARNGSIMVIFTNDQSVKEISRIPPVRCITDGKESLCIGPLGMRLHENETALYVMDSYAGLFKVDLTNFGHTNDLLPIHKVFPTERNPHNFSFLFLDDFDILPDGTIIMSEASTQFGLFQFAYDILQGKPTGRLLQFDPKSEQHFILADNLQFPNGIQAHPDGESVLVSETGRGRVHRYYYKGSKKGKLEIFIPKLPGAPDNIRLTSNKDGFWIALFATRDPNACIKTGAITEVPSWIRDIIALVINPSILFHTFVPEAGFFVKADLEGNILLSVQDPRGKVISHITEVNEASNGTLYLGNIYHNFIGRLDGFILKTV